MEIYHNVQQRLKNTLIQMSQSITGDEGTGEYAGFDKPERLQQTQIQGGLRQSSNHQFQAPSSSSYSSSSSSGMQKPPGVSMLGLDKLAAQKRAASRMTISMNDDDEGVNKTSSLDLFKFTKTSTMTSTSSSRNYRTASNSANDTPSHPGGVHHSARDKQQADRYSRDRNGKNSYHSSDHLARDRDRDRNRDRERNGGSSHGWNRSRDRHREPWRGGGDRREDERKRSRGRSRNRSRSRSRDRDRDGDRNRGQKSRGDRHGTEKQVTGVRVYHSKDDWEAPQRLTSVLQNTGDEWENPTPLRSSDISSISGGGGSRSSSRGYGGRGYDDDDDDDSASPRRYSDDDDDDAFDRDFYLSEEGTLGSSGGDFSSGEKFLGSSKKFKEREEAMAKSRMRGDCLNQSKAGSSKVVGMSARKSQLHVDQQAWEENRLMQSGVAEEKEYNLDIDNEEDQRVTLIVHNLKPPFLDGRVSYSLQQSTVSTIRDPTCDFANNARNGSALLRDVRTKREQMKMRKRFWELGGSAMGDAMGLQKPADEEATKVPTATELGRKGHDGEDDHDSDEEGVDYKHDSSFAKHQKKAVAQSQFAKSKSIREQREFLPVFTVRDSLLEVMRDNQIVIIVGETGSGKTTQLTQYLHESGYTEYGMVGCTQPRRVAAMSVAKRVAEEFGCELGEEVGYAIRFEDVTGPKTLIKYMTDGVLLRESLREPDLDAYSCIVMDEAHERSLHTDILFGILKKIVMKRRDLKLVVTSATLNADRFSEFFGSVPIFRLVFVRFLFFVYICLYI